MGRNFCVYICPVLPQSTQCCPLIKIYLRPRCLQNVAEGPVSVSSLSSHLFVLILQPEAQHDGRRSTDDQSNSQDNASSAVKSRKSSISSCITDLVSLQLTEHHPKGIDKQKRCSSHSRWQCRGQWQQPAWPWVEGW